MKLRMKLMLAPAVTGAMLALTLGASIWVLNGYQTNSEGAHKQVLQAFTKVAAVQSQLSDLHTQLYRTVTIAASLDEKALKATRDQQATTLTGIASDAKKTADASTDEAIKADLASFVAQVVHYQKSADSAIDLSSVDANTGVAALQTADFDFKAMNGTLATVIGRVQLRAASVTDQLEAAGNQSSRALAVVGLLAVIAALAFSWITQRRIVASVKSAAETAARVADGRLDVQATSDDRDELGDLLRALGSMVGQLRASIQTVQQATESIGTASAEIATGNQDLSGRTEQTASNLQQAASSMEQLTGTVKQSADSARQANQLASSAAEVAQRGGVVVAQVVATMEDINTSSRKISDIIGVIDGIAFQTNILALNAAVEAARAGEQGRGFAVVAGEVRSLAQRSAEAAKEIKSLIGASVEKVQGGSKLVADAGQTMSEIVSSVQRVSDIIGEITAASSEQSEGIGQISGSVNQLDQMTQQNAALVEESAAAAESLREQVARLSVVVGAFKLGDGDGDRVARSLPHSPVAAPKSAVAHGHSVNRPTAAAASFSAKSPNALVTKFIPKKAASTIAGAANAAPAKAGAHASTAPAAPTSLPTLTQAYEPKKAALKVEALAVANGDWETF